MCAFHVYSAFCEQQIKNVWFELTVKLRTHRAIDLPETQLRLLAKHLFVIVPHAHAYTPFLTRHTKGAHLHVLWLLSTYVGGCAPCDIAEHFQAPVCNNAYGGICVFCISFTKN